MSVHLPKGEAEGVVFVFVLQSSVLWPLQLGDVQMVLVL